ncbi:hypothetical protein Dimus_036463, partial [Dionaea muscipula]
MARRSSQAADSRTRQWLTWHLRSKKATWIQARPRLAMLALKAARSISQAHAKTPNSSVFSSGKHSKSGRHPHRSATACEEVHRSFRAVGARVQLTAVLHRRHEVAVEFSHSERQ